MTRTDTRNSQYCKIFEYQSLTGVVLIIHNNLCSPILIPELAAVLIKHVPEVQNLITNCSGSQPMGSNGR